MRRTIALLMLSILTAAPTAPAAVGKDESWDFRVFLDDKEIGTHRFDIAGSGAARTLTSKAHFNVRFLFVNAYTYEHEAVEGWDGDCLASLESHTDDNGKIHRVEARHNSEATVVRTPRDTQSLGQCVMTFAYWNPSMLKQSRLLNSQNGEYVDVTIAEVGSEDIKVRGVSTPARRYALRSKGMAIDLWYANDAGGDAQWLALESVTEGGRKLSYRLR